MIDVLTAKDSLHSHLVGSAHRSKFLSNLRYTEGTNVTMYAKLTWLICLISFR